MPTWLCAGGTRLATPQGTIAVERIVPGMMLAARDGGTLVAGAVGRIQLSAAELAARPALWPVRVAAGALADGVPAADTVVLADQPLGVAGVAAKWLVNGLTLDRAVPVAPLDVFSLSLDGAGVPAGAMCLGDDLGPSPRPDDTVLLAARRDLAARAGPAFGLPAGALLGSIDAVTGHQLEGWADDGSGRPVALELVIDGITSPPVLADRPRDDLAAAGIGDGRRGLVVMLDPPLDPRRRHLLRVRRALDGADLPGSPILLDAVATLPALLDALPTDAARRLAVQAAARAVAARLAAPP